MFKLDNRTVLVTGASSGIGEAVAHKMAALGARVVVTSERKEGLARVAVSINRSGGCAIPVQADFTNEDEVAGLFARAEEAAGDVEVLVNNAGVGMHAHVGHYSQSAMRRLFEVNFFALSSLCAQALARMGERGSGRIINVSSAAGQFGCGAYSAYAASKGALHAYTQSLRVEARPRGVFVSEIVPVSVRTPFFENAHGEPYKPMGVVQTPDAVAAGIVRCAMSNRPPPEVWPYPWIRLVFLLNAIAPGMMVKLNARIFKHDQTKQ